MTSPMNFMLAAAVSATLFAGCATPHSELSEPSAAFENFESPYFVFQFTKGENWVEGKSVFEQDLQGHFKFMADLERRGVLLHGGPMDRGEGEDILGVIRADSLAQARAIIIEDPALISGIHDLVSVNRWIAAAGSGVGIDKKLVRPITP